MIMGLDWMLGSVVHWKMFEMRVLRKNFTVRYFFLRMVIIEMGI